LGQSDLWVSRRNSVEEPWGAPENLGLPINSAGFDVRPNLSRDGHWLFFSSNRPGALSPGLDIWASYRTHVHDDFAWQPPVPLGSGVNVGGASDIEASYIENDDGNAPQLFFVSNRFGPFDVFVSERLPDGTWGAASLVPELSGPQTEQSVSVRFDGLEAFIVRGVPPFGFDIWASTRETVFDAWSDPVIVGAPLNSSTSEESPHIAAHGETVYFESTRPGVGGRDLWMATRKKARGSEVRGR
jgi:hypothetical protein